MLLVCTGPKHTNSLRSFM